MYKKILLSLLIAALLIVFAGCKPAPAPNTPSNDDISVVLIIDRAKGDPVSEMIYTGGLSRLQSEIGEDKMSIKLIEAINKGEHKNQVRTAIESGANPVLTMWDDLADVVVELAPSYPETNFILIDVSTALDLPNVKTLVIEPMESSFIAGVVTALTTKTNKVGFVGGADIPVIEKFYTGYTSGVKYINKNIDVVEVYAGTFTDPAKGNEIGTMLFNQGCDIVMHAANMTGIGVLQSAEATGNFGIGVDMWQGDVAPGHVLWSALKPLNEATYIATKEAISGKFEGGEWIYGVEQGAPLYDKRDFNELSSEAQTSVLSAVEKIKSDTFQVPSSKAELQIFINNLE